MLTKDNTKTHPDNCLLTKKKYQLTSWMFHVLVPLVDHVSNETIVFLTLLMLFYLLNDCLLVWGSANLSIECVLRSY